MPSSHVPHTPLCFASNIEVLRYNIRDVKAKHCSGVVIVLVLNVSQHNVYLRRRYSMFNNVPKYARVFRVKR